jgi:endonuclease/exonuclease/phosphatase family metal-dependent hydrolase
MKLMAYNILGGWKDRMDLIIETVEEESPDCLVLNEANALLPDLDGHLALLSARTGLLYTACAPSGEDTFHVIMLSRRPFKRTEFLAPFARAGLLCVLDSEFGEVAIVGTHLTPYDEVARLKEINVLLNATARIENVVLMGDLNALSHEDEYAHLTFETMNEKQRAKFTEDQELRFDVIRKLRASGYLDSAVLQGKHHIHTVPTALKDDIAHAHMRLDYIFVSPALAPYLDRYEVVKDRNTHIASDHYPVTAELRKVSSKKSSEQRRRIIEGEWFGFDWDVQKVWDLDVAEEYMSVKELEWHLDISLWDHQGQESSVTPRQVLERPDRHEDHFRDIIDSDLSHALDIMWWKEHWLILDGVHRLAKLVREGASEVRVRKIPHSAIPSIKK